MINPLKFYTVSELLKLARQGFFPLVHRQSIHDRIKDGSLQAKNFGDAGKRPNWKISGENVLAFLATGTVEKKVIQNKNVKRTPRTKKKKDEKSLQETEREVQS